MLRIRMVFPSTLQVIKIFCIQTSGGMFIVMALQVASPVSHLVFHKVHRHPIALASPLIYCVQCSMSFSNFDKAIFQLLTISHAYILQALRSEQESDQRKTARGK